MKQISTISRRRSQFIVGLIGFILMLIGVAPIAPAAAQGRNGPVILTQSNETENTLMVFQQGSNGALTLVQEAATGGAGSDGARVVTGETSAPDALFTSNSVVSSTDGRLAFVVNGGDNSVSMFRRTNSGMKLVDVEETGNEILGSANSVAYNEKDRALYVSHAVGGEIAIFRVNTQSGLTKLHQTRNTNHGGNENRVTTQILIDPTGRFLISTVVLDDTPANAGGLVPSTEANIVTFRIRSGGRLGRAMFNSAGAPTPFASVFIDRDSMLTAMAGTNLLEANDLMGSGRIVNKEQVAIAQFNDVAPAETCWVAVTEDRNFAYASNYSYGTITSIDLRDGAPSVLEQEAAFIEGDGTFSSLAGIPTSGPGDLVASDGYLHQLAANASAIVTYEIGEDGSLTEQSRAAVPYNSTVGLWVVGQ